MLLNNGRWFSSHGIRTEGKVRLDELALFLQEYLQKKVPEGKTEGSAFKQLNNWAVLAWLKPGELAADIVAQFKDSWKTYNEKAHLWLIAQMDKVNQQYDYKLTGNDDELTLSPFYKVLHYANARDKELRKGHSESVYQNAKAIYEVDDGGVAENAVQVTLPLMRTVVERTEKEMKMMQKVYALFVGVEDKNGHSMPADQLLLAAMTVFVKKRSVDSVRFETQRLANAEASSAAIKQALQKFYEKATSQDIILFFFSGKALLNDINQLVCNTPADSAVVDTFSELDFNKIAANSGKNCRSVIILDTSTGYYPWGTDNDIFIGATTNSPQASAINSAEYSTFLDTLIKLLVTTEISYTYKDILSLLRHSVNDTRRGRYEESPVIRMPKKIQSNYFLSKWGPPEFKYPLLAYSESHQCWRLIEEDFIIVQPNSNCYVSDYETKERIADVRGELFVNRENNFLQFGGLTNLLDQRKVYHAEYTRHELIYDIIMATGAEWLSVLREFEAPAKDLYGEPFSNWGDVVAAKGYSGDKDHFLLKLQTEYYYGALLIDVKNDEKEFCEISLHYPAKGENEKFDGKEFDRITTIAKKAADIIPTIHKLVRYQYLLELARPANYYVGYKELDLSYRWNMDETITSSFTTIIISDESFFFDGGRVHCKPIVLTLINNELFTVFYEIYMLAPDLTIKRVSGNAINFVERVNEKTIFISEPELMEKALSSSTEIIIKILTSRDPIIVDFSQKPV